ncbi:hypothetical protein MJO29_004904 [Puccinia striiformis f. sp. tritici]|nr:hypothetical protein MJO29_004904 [Puccinia striiformis f. sp. tritici]
MDMVPFQHAGHERHRRLPASSNQASSNQHQINTKPPHLPQRGRDTSQFISFKKLWLLTSNVNPTSFFTTETSNVNPTSFFTTDVPTQKNKQLNFKNEFACKPISHGLENDALINPQTHQSLQGLL